jgi:hypothetical protein
MSWSKCDRKVSHQGFSTFTIPYNPIAQKDPLDIFVVLANVNMIGAHFVGSVTALGLFNWLDQ